ncbi:hypothetical protein G3N58_15100 [Paraburkholderia sp. Ac-20342]|uniref:hypothetical protein n=1 Tax=Paraburkholderia sp. Ac-20342 TaxID=2703889 RepID=UPI0019813DE2|nr:hypothetical protein [Paraburkholderia sp. Ac-20342]MBN3848147.1 hypothetical protein [Paraburkholderia sp. Ac-20342]
MPPPEVTLTDPSGRLRPVWREFLLALFTRTGGIGGGDLAGLTATVLDHTKELGEHAEEIADLQLTVETNPYAALMTAILGRVVALEALVMGLPVAVPASPAWATLPDPIGVHISACSPLPEPVASCAPQSDDTRKLIEG